jgi:S-adenosylmethionine synthetase
LITDEKYRQEKQMVVILELRVTTNWLEIYGEINKLETTEIEELKFYDHDEKYNFVWFCGFITAEIGLRNRIY